MKVALYARVSTSDKGQNPETQLLAMREFSQAQGWVVFDEYVDRAAGNDLGHRSRWKTLLNDAAKKRFSAVLVFKLDRAFRSVKHMHDTLAAWELLGVGFKSLREQFDTVTALGRLLLNLLASLAKFELELIRGRVRAGMDRARKQGRPIGRPSVTSRKGFEKSYGAVLERLRAGAVSRRQAAKELNIGYATLLRLMEEHAPDLLTQVGR